MDESIFPDPLTFRPERWIENPGLPLHAFGFGRRTCTGQHVSNNSLFIILARILWALDIKKALNDQGQEIEIDDMAFTSGFNSRPEPFGARFLPRGERAVEVIRNGYENTESNIDLILTQISSAQGKGLRKV